MFERFTESARQVVVGAQKSARQLRSEYIGSEHILLALVDPDRGISAAVLQAQDLTPSRIEAAIELIVGPGESTISGQIPFTPSAKMVLENSLRESLVLGHNYIGPEHILLGLLRETEGVGHQILVDFELDTEEIRREVRQLLGADKKAAVRPTAEGLAVEQPPQTTTLSDAMSEEALEGPDEDDPESIEVVPTHPDRPAVRDELGRKRLAAVVAERIRRARDEDPETQVETWIQRRSKLRRDTRAGRGAKSFLVHIHAPWGAGKSSLLNFLATDLRNRGSSTVTTAVSRAARALVRPRTAEHLNLSQWIVVEFSAWKHQRLTPPWWWLLASVQRSCTRELWRINRGRWLWFWIRDIAWRLWNARVIAITALLLVGIAATAWQLNWFGLPDKKLSIVQTVVLTSVSVIGLVTAIAEIVRGTGRWLAVGSAEGAVRFLKRAHDPLKVYRRRFRWLVHAAGRPLTVFIDDLDRCRPDYVVELLEGIQTLFVNESVTYVVAADRTWLCESFARAYDDFKNAVGEPGRPLGYLFLEKTFQISLEIPPMSDHDHERYWRLLMEGEGRNGAHTRPKRRSAEIAAEFAGASTQAEVEQGIRTLVDAGEDLEEVRTAAVRRLNAPRLQDQQKAQLTEFAPLVEKNPRSMKRLLNAYGIERDRLLRDGYLLTQIERRQLALLTIFRLRWPELAERLRLYPDEAAYFFDPDSEPSADFPYIQLRNDAELRNVLDGDQVEAALDPGLLVHFPGHPPA